MFYTYFSLGFEHIADINAYDHILFIIALCAIYKVDEWRKLLILVTAFTIGHSLTLALAVLDIIRFKASIIELLIPVTILLTCLFNIFLPAQSSTSSTLFNKSLNSRYFFACFFGLIHGMGFSNYLRSLLMPGEEGDLLGQLLAFNIGIELGQLLIVLFILLMSIFVYRVLKISQRNWSNFLSIVIGAAAIHLLLELW